MNKYEIRTATYEDLESLTGIYNQAIGAGEKTAHTSPVTIEDRRHWFYEHNPDSHPIIAAVSEGKVAGYISISQYRPGRGALKFTAEISYYIDFAHHRHGAASALMTHIISLCPYLKIRTLFAILIETNIGSIKLLEKFGFEKWGFMPGVAQFNGKEVGQFYYGLRINPGKCKF